MPLDELEALVQEGQAIGIKMDSLAELAGRASLAKAWDQQAAACLTRDQPQHAQHAKHRKQIQTPSLATVTELLQQHDSLAVAVPHAADLLKKQRQALDWVSKAEKALQQSNPQQHSADVQVSHNLKLVARLIFGKCVCHVKAHMAWQGSDPERPSGNV